MVMLTSPGSSQQRTSSTAQSSHPDVLSGPWMSSFLCLEHIPYFAQRTKLTLIHLFVLRLGFLQEDGPDHPPPIPTTWKRCASYVHLMPALFLSLQGLLYNYLFTFFILPQNFILKESTFHSASVKFLWLMLGSNLVSKYMLDEWMDTGSMQKR